MSRFQQILTKARRLRRADHDAARRLVERALGRPWSTSQRAELLLELAEGRILAADGEGVLRATDEALQLLGSDGPGYLRGHALLLAHYGRFYSDPDNEPHPGDLLEAAGLLEEVDPYRAAECHIALGEAALRGNDLESAWMHFETAAPLFRRGGSNLGIPQALRGLAKVALGRGDLEIAMRYALRAHEESEGLNGMRGAAARILTAEVIGDIHSAAGRTAEALVVYREAFELSRPWGRFARLRHIEAKIAELEDPDDAD